MLLNITYFIIIGCCDVKNLRAKHLKFLKRLESDLRTNKCLCHFDVLRKQSRTPWRWHR